MDVKNCRQGSFFTANGKLLRIYRKYSVNYVIARSVSKPAPAEAGVAISSFHRSQGLLRFFQSLAMTDTGFTEYLPTTIAFNVFDTKRGLFLKSAFMTTKRAWCPPLFIGGRARRNESADSLAGGIKRADEEDSPNAL